MKVLWHFECSDSTHYVEWQNGKRVHMKRMSEEEYAEFTAEQNENDLSFLD